MNEHAAETALRELVAHCERAPLSGSSHTIRLVLFSLGGYAQHFKVAVNLSRLRSLDDKRTGQLLTVMAHVNLFDDRDFFDAAGGEAALKALKRVPEEPVI